MLPRREVWRESERSDGNCMDQPGIGNGPIAGTTPRRGPSSGCLPPREIVDYFGQKLSFQFDGTGRLVAAVRTSAPGSKFFCSTVCAFQYERAYTTQMFSKPRRCTIPSLTFWGLAWDWCAPASTVGLVRRRIRLEEAGNSILM